MQLRFRAFLEASEVGPESDAEDVATAIASAHEALEHVEQIGHRSDSHFSASLRGGPQFLGWTEDRYIAAATHDNILAIVAGLGGTSLDASDLVQRPRVTTAKAVHATTIAEFDTGNFMAWLMS